MQQLDTLAELAPTTRADMQGLWNAWSGILKTKGKLHRSLRKPVHHIHKRIYTVLSTPGFDAGAAGEGGDCEHWGDGPGAVTMAKVAVGETTRLTCRQMLLG